MTDITAVWISWLNTESSQKNLIITHLVNITHQLIDLTFYMTLT